MILGRTLPVGAVPARLLRSGEYNIRFNIDLIEELQGVSRLRTPGWRLAATVYDDWRGVSTIDPFGLMIRRIG
jgi:hypothetical protein